MEIKDMTQEEKEQRIKEILEAFRNFDGKYKREEVDDAIELKEEITPYLIEVLEGMLADPKQYTENPDLFDHIYILMLIGNFKESKAHKLIVDIFSLPPELPGELFGDMITEDLPYLLLNTCGGNIDHIKSLILKKDADEFCRSSACRALTYAVVKGYTTREETLTFFETLFTGNEAEDGSHFWSMLASSAHALYPDNIIDTIKQAYENELIDPITIALKDFENDLTLEQDEVLKRLEQTVKADKLGDVHKNMSWWACFNKETETSQKKKAQTQKNRKKRARKSKNKNRGKKKKK